jgi:uncharacterized protein (TIGR02246 family)
MTSLRVTAACLVALGTAAAGGEGQAPDETAKLVTYLAREVNYRFVIVGGTPAKRLEEILADDAAIVWSNGERSTGKAECLQRIAKARDDIRELFKDFAVTCEPQKVRLLGDVAVILAKVTLLGTLAENEKPFRRESWQTLLFARAEDRWRLVHEHSSQLAPPKLEGPRQKDVVQ